MTRSQASLLGPDGPCKGVGSPNGWYAVPQQPGICMNRPALETIPPWLRNPANHDKGTLSRSRASLLGPDGPCKGVGSPHGWYAVPQQPGIVRSQLRCYRGHGAIAVTARSRSHRDRGHSAIGYRVSGAIAVTARSRSRRNRGHSAIAVTASSRSWRDRGPGTGRLQPPPTSPAPASRHRSAPGPDAPLRIRRAPRRAPPDTRSEPDAGRRPAECR